MFLEEFAQQYTDTQAAERARVALESLRMKAPEIDEYISKFEELCNKAGYTMGNTEVTYVTATGWKQLKTQSCRAKSLRRLRISLE